MFLILTMSQILTRVDHRGGKSIPKTEIDLFESLALNQSWRCHAPPTQSNLIRDQHNRKDESDIKGFVLPTK